MKLIYCLMILLCLFLNGLAQPPAAKVQPLKTGEKLPQVKLSKFYNHPGTTLSLNDFKGKLIILDFWATWCGSCVEGFPKMEKLQKQFNNKVKIVLVNDQQNADEKFLKTFFEKRKTRTGMENSITIVFGDTMLKTYFPHKTIPHCVWIDEFGKLLAVTYPEAVTEENINKVLKGGAGVLETKKDELLFDISSPLLTAQNGGDPVRFLYRSVITEAIEGMGATGGIVTDDLGNVTRLYDVNTPLIALYTMAYPEVFTKEIKDIFFEAPGLDFRALYCYEIITAALTKKELYKCVQEDLYRYFKVVAKKELRPVKCYSMVTNPNIKTSFTKTNSPAEDVNEATLKKFMYNKSIDALLQNFGSYLDKPVLNETGLCQNIDMDFPFNFYKYSPAQFKQFYFDKGLTLVEVTRDLPVAVLMRTSVQK